MCGKSELQTCLWREALMPTANRALQHKPTDTNAERQGCFSCDGCCVVAAVRGAAAGSCRVRFHSALDLQRASNDSCSVLDPLFCLSTLIFSYFHLSHWSILGIIFSSLDTELDTGTSLNPHPLPFLTYL